MRYFRGLQRRTKRKPNGTGFSSLADELIQEVLAYLWWPTDFYILSLVSRNLYRHATPELYSTLVIAYHRPERIIDLLNLLETNIDKTSLVKTLLFDEDVKSIGPNLTKPGRWPPRDIHRRELADGWNTATPHEYGTNSDSDINYPWDGRHVEIAKRLHTILPSLRNLRSVVMRSLHGVFMLPGAFQQWGDIIAESGLSTARSLSRRDVWEYIFDGSPHITEIFATGFTGGMLTGRMVSVLTTICISDLFLYKANHAHVALGWNTVLAHAQSLRTLCMVQVQYAHVILNRRSFPRLQALELYMVLLEDGPTMSIDVDSRVFTDFLYRHSTHLRVLALSAPLWGSIDHRRWLIDSTIFPNLHTLRLDHLSSLLAVMEVPWGVRSDAPRSADIQADIIKEFVKNRPGIVDLGVSDLNNSKADDFAQELSATRNMRNVMIGSSANQSLLSRTYQNYMSTAGRAHWDYGREAWSFYVLFGGLTITKSGFRPNLPRQSWWQKLM